MLKVGVVVPGLASTKLEGEGGGWGASTHISVLSRNVVEITLCLTIGHK